MPTDNSREIFVKNFREQIAKRGVTQRELADAFGVSTATISDWVNGRKYPRIDAMQRIADYFGLLMSQLTTDDKRTATDADTDRLEALHQDPRLCLLFDRARKMSSEDVDFMLKFADKILGERESE